MSRLQQTILKSSRAVGDIVLTSHTPPDLCPQLDRSEGIHISQVIQDICIQRGLYSEQLVVPRARWELGKALERALILALEHDYPSRYITPGEITYDGLKGTPDLCDLWEEEIPDIKLTDRSSGDTPELLEPVSPDHPIHSDKFWANWTQVMCYCKMIGWKHGGLYLFHQRGDYRERRDQVIYHAWRQTFSDHELGERWLMIRKHADKYHCKRCGSTVRIDGGCYHCAWCLRDIVTEEHAKGCSHNV